MTEDALLPDPLPPRATQISCDVSSIGRPSLATVDALAHLQLVARRHGLQVVILRASPQLCELLALAGLVDVLPASNVEPMRQAESREEAPGVQEEGDAADPFT